MWHVYQFRNDTELLYVGYTRRLVRRLGEHRREKTWWAEVTCTRSEEFATEDEARQREKELWASERPKYNQVSPFKTDEEVRAYDRVRDRKRNQIPERRQYKAEHQRRGRRGGVRSWHQTGPGLF